MNSMHLRDLWLPLITDNKVVITYLKGIGLQQKVVLVG